MIKNNEKGFTLVEVLATITILSIVLLISTPVISSLVKKFNNNYYKTLEGSIRLAGIDYFTDNKKEVPKYIGETSTVLIDELVKNGYLEEQPKNRKKEDISGNDNYVVMYKTAKGKYSYYACLSSDGYSTDDKFCSSSYKEGSEYIVPPINGLISLPTKYNEYSDKLSDYIMVFGAGIYKNTTDGDGNKLRGLVDNDNVVEVASAYVSIEKNNKREKINLEGNIEEALVNYIKGQIGEVSDDESYTKALNEFLNQKPRVYYTYIYNDKTVESVYTITKAKSFNGEEFAVSLYYDNDKEVSNNVGGLVYTDNIISSEINWSTNKISAYYSSKTEGSSMISNYICKIYDKENKKYSSPIYCDPESTVVDGKMTQIYSNSDQIMQVFGISEYGVKITSNIITYGVKNDTVNPKLSGINIIRTSNNTCNTTLTYGNYSFCEYQNNTWSNSNVYLSGKYVNGKWQGPTGKDNFSGIKEYQIKDSPNGSWVTYNYDNTKEMYKIASSNTGTHRRYIRAVDNAGNVSDEKEYIIKIDNVKPSKPTPVVSCSNPGNNGWCKGDITVTVPDGNTPESDNSSGTVTYISDDEGEIWEPTDKYPMNDDGEKTIDVKVCTNSGTCSDEITTEVKIDKTKPTCSVSGGSSTWINANSSTTSRTITARCSDSGSGCIEKSFSKIYSSDINTTTAGAKGNNNGGTVYDNAGNSRDCSANQTVKIDKTKPTCTSSGGSSSWTSSSVTITGTCSDSGSGCKNSKVTKSFSSETNKTSVSPGSISDNAGNSTTCPANQTVKIEGTITLSLDTEAMKTTKRKDSTTDTIFGSTTRYFSSTNAYGCTNCTLGKPISGSTTYAYSAVACENVYDYIRYFKVNSNRFNNKSVNMPLNSTTNEYDNEGKLVEITNEAISRYGCFSNNTLNAWSTSCGSSTGGNPDFTKHVYQFQSSSGKNSNKVVLYTRYSADCGY